MTEKPFPFDGDERIFTLSDVKRLFIQKRKIVFRAAILGALFFFGCFLLKAPKYKIEATFKEGVEKSGQESALSDFLSGFAFSGGQPQAIALMKSYQVLRPLVEKMGLQAQISRGRILSKVYRRVRDNLRAERRKPLADLDPFVFENVRYEGEDLIDFWVRFEDDSRFSLLDGSKRVVAESQLGQKIELPETSFTLAKAPKNLRLKRCYPLTIGSWLPTAKGLRDQLQIVNSKANKSIYDLTLLHRDRRFGVRLLNELMAEYQRYLKKDHDQIATAQLDYLEAKQDQIYQKLKSVFDEQTTYLKSNLAESGFAGVQEEGNAIISMHQDMMGKLIAISLELARLEQWEKEGKWSPPAADNIFSRQLMEAARSIAELNQQRDLLELSLQDGQPIVAERLEERQEELREIRSRREAAKGVLSAFEKEGDSTSQCLFDPEKTLANWAERLQASRGEEKQDFAEYMKNHIRLLAVHEKMLQERFFYNDSASSEFDGVDLTTLRDLYVDYNTRLDKAEAAMCSYAQLKSEVDQKNFELGSLSSVLQDPLSISLIHEASKTVMLLKDEKHHSAKEGARWEEDLALQKKILRDHLEQLFNVEEINASLIRNKISGLRRATLDGIHRQISVLTEQVTEGLKERREALLREKNLLEEKMKGLRDFTAGFPDKWQRDEWLKLKIEMGTGMMQTMTQLVEAKTIGHHLHHVESKPLDYAQLPTVPQKPNLINMALFGAFGAGFGTFFLQLLRTLMKGFPTSCEKLRAMRYPLLGEISSSCDGPGFEKTRGADLELLRQLALFLEDPPQAKIVSLLAGRGPDYSYALAENLALRSIRPIIVRCDFQSKFQKEGQTGLLQIWKGEADQLPIQRMKGFDVLMAGGYTPYGQEAIQSPAIRQLLDGLKNKYDVLFLLFRAPLDSAESLAALKISEKAIVTVSGEPTEMLTPFANWAYHENRCRLNFVASS